MTLIWPLEYLFTGLLSFWLMAEFIRTKDGVLRKLLIVAFFAIGFGTSVVGIDGLLDQAYGHVVEHDLLRTLSITPILFSLLVLAIYLRFTYHNNKDK